MESISSFSYLTKAQDAFYAAGDFIREHKSETAAVLTAVALAALAHHLGYTEVAYDAFKGIQPKPEVVQETPATKSWNLNLGGIDSEKISETALWLLNGSGSVAYQSASYGKRATVATLRGIWTALQYPKLSALATFATWFVAVEKFGFRISNHLPQKEMPPPIRVRVPYFGTFHI